MLPENLVYPLALLHRVDFPSGFLCDSERGYHSGMISKIFSPAQIVYLQLLEVALPEVMEGQSTSLQQEARLVPVTRLPDMPATPPVRVIEDIPELSAEDPLADAGAGPQPPAIPAVETATPTDVVPAPEEDRIARIARMDWAVLEASIHACRACSLGETRKNAVVGAGTRPSPWLFVGEAPGAEEDRRGEAFVGRGGQLLDAMLGAMGLSRQEQVYIANVLKCRPPQNRDPLGPEVRSCLPFLQRQIALLQPRIIVAMGRFAAQSLLQSAEPLASLRGSVQRYGDIPLIVTYHPAYLLRNPIEKRKVWEDLKLALQTYADLPQGSDAKASPTA